MTVAPTTGQHTLHREQVTVTSTTRAMQQKGAMTSSAVMAAFIVRAKISPTASTRAMSTGAPVDSPAIRAAIVLVARNAF